MRWIWGALLAVALFGVLLVQFAGDPEVDSTRDPAPGLRAVTSRAAEGSEPALPEASPSGTIYGSVRRGLEPCPARIEVRRFPALERGARALRVDAGRADAIVAGQADETGRYEVTGVPAGRFEVRAIADDGATGRAVVTVPAPGAREVADIAVPSGGLTLSGRAVHADGRPFRGGVAAQTLSQPRDPLRVDPSPTDEEGRFLLTGLDSGEQRLIAVVDGTVRHVGGRILVPHEGDLLFVVDDGYRTLTGRVVAGETRTGVPGAVVVAAGGENEGRYSVARVVTDAEGWFQARLPDGYWALEIGAEGYWPVETWGERWDEPVEIRLDPLASVTGRVLAAEDRRPLPGIPVFAVAVHGEWGFAAEPIGRARSGADGSFAFAGLAAEELMVVARGNGWITKGLATYVPGSFNPLAFRLGAGGSRVVEILVERAAVAEGVVLRADASPVPGAVVAVTAADPGRPVPLDPVQTATDAEGRFRLESLPPGVAHLFEATHPEGAKGTAGPRAGGPGETITVEIRLPPERILEVRLVEVGTDRPIAGAHVSVFPEGGGKLESPRWITNTEGALAIGPMPAGPVSLWCVRSGYVSAAEKIGADRADPVVIGLARAPAISGRVLMPGGAPANHGTVLGLEEEQTRSTAAIALDGRFVISGLSEGTSYRLKALVETGQGLWAGETRAMPGDDEVVIELDETVTVEPASGGMLRILVIDPDGRPVPRGTIDVIAFDDQGVELYSMGGDMRGGRFEAELEGNEAEFWIEVSGHETHAGARLDLAPKLVGPVVPGAGEVVIRVGEPREISGVVLGPGGEPIRGCRVTARARYPERLSLWAGHGGQWTGERGEFTLTGLGDCEYEIYASAPPGYSYGDPVITTPGDESVTIRLKRAGSAKVKVLDPEGKPVAGASVSAVRIFPDGGTSYGISNAVTDQNGFAELRSLPKDRVLGLVAGPPSGRTDLFPYRDLEWSIGDCEVRLPRGYMVRGIVRDESGSPAAGVGVWGRSPNALWIHEMPVPGDEKGWRAVLTGPDGRFAVGPWPSGTVEVIARPRGGTPHLWESVFRTVRAGESGVDLRIVTGASIRIRVADWPEDAGWVTGTLTADGQKKMIYGQIQQGRVEFGGLPGDREFTFHVGPVGDGLMVYLRGLRPGGEEIEAALTPGQAVSGRLLLPPEAVVSWVSVEGDGYDVWADVGTEGRFVLLGIPDGPCRVTAEIEVGEETIVKSVPTRAGAELTIDFTR